MTDLRRHQLTNVALFVGGVGIAFAFEAVGTNVGLFRHRMRPQIASVPVTILLAWPSVVYVAYRIARLVTPAAVPAAALAAAIATAGDALVDPAMVERGAWEYPETAVSHPRFRGVPWWNFAGWLVIVFVTALLPAFVAG
ncbi:MAG: carotenoid biosynthesis protein [Haloferacaceae archaeon]